MHRLHVCVLRLHKHYSAELHRSLLGVNCVAKECRPRNHCKRNRTDNICHICTRYTHACMRTDFSEEDRYSRVSLRVYTSNLVSRLVDTIRRVRLIPRRWPRIRITLRMRNLNWVRLRERHDWAIDGASTIEDTRLDMSIWHVRFSKRFLFL